MISFKELDNFLHVVSVESLDHEQVQLVQITNDSGAKPSIKYILYLDISEKTRAHITSREAHSNDILCDVGHV